MQALIDQLMDWLDKPNWMAVVFAIVLVSLSVDFVQRQILKRLERRAQQSTNLWDDAFVHALIKPLSLLIWMFGITLAAQVAFSQVDQDPAVLDLVQKVWVIGLVVAVTWALVRLARGVERNLMLKRDPEEALDVTTVSAVSKLIRASILITSALVVMQQMGLEITGVLAFGGIGGLAVGLAAKDLLANFFGGFTVYVDRPFKVGDWILSPDRQIEGVVERIGWRQTTIRKFDRRPLYLPNSTFLSIAVENPSRMTHRRIYETIGIRYQDADKMESIVAAVKQMLQSHPGIDTRQTLIVNFNAFAASSLDFFVYALTKTTDWIEYHRIKEEVLLTIEKIIREHGAEIAFPTSTLHHVMPPQLAGMTPPAAGDPK